MHGDLAGLHGNDFGDLIQAFPLWITSIPGRQVEWLYVMTFFLLWEYVLAGIVQGQIVDAFAGIRAEQDMKADDLAANCLVCSVDRLTLDSYDGFIKHVEEDHAPGSYLKFCTQIKEIPHMNVMSKVVFHRTGMMKYVHELLVKGDYTWIPKGTSLAMANKPQEDPFQGLDANVEATQEHLKQMSATQDSRHESIKEEMAAVSNKVDGGLFEVSAQLAEMRELIVSMRSTIDNSQPESQAH